MAKPVAEDVDWPALERDYRLGHLSDRELARAFHTSHTTIARHAKKHNWKRDLSAKVRETVRESLIREDAAQAERSTERSTGKDQDDVATVNAAAAVGMAVVRKHRRSLERTHALAAAMLDDLEGVRKAKDGIAETILSDKTSDKRRKRAMLQAVDLPNQVDTLASLTGTLGKLIPLERKAFNLDAGESKEKTPAEQFIEQVSGRSIRPVE